MEEGYRVMIKWVAPEDLGQHWQSVAPYLGSAIKAGGNLLSAEHVVDELVGQKMDLFLVKHDDDVVGVVVTQVMRNVRGRFLHVVLAGLNKRLQTLNSMNSGLEEMAQDNGMQGVTWSSQDERWGAWAKRNGYDKRFVEYVKEF